MIGVFGGTFDPIHLGHLRVALEVKEQLHLTQMRFVPSRTPPHRVTPETGAVHRAAMVEVAIRGVPGFLLDRSELERDGPSYMIDTLTSLYAEVSDPLCLILGYDAFAGLNHWHRWHALFDFAHVVVLNRAGTEGALPDELISWIKPRQTDSADALARVRQGRVLFVNMLNFAVAASASQVRQLMAAGKDVRFLLTDPVIEYIRVHRLYRA